GKGPPLGSVPGELRSNVREYVLLSSVAQGGLLVDCSALPSAARSTSVNDAVVLGRALDLRWTEPQDEVLAAASSLTDLFHKLKIQEAQLRNYRVAILRD